MKKYLIIIGIICGILSQSVLVFAGEEDAKIKAELVKQLDEAPISQCKEKLIPIFDLELKDFFKFLDESFQNKSSNSSLTNIAIVRYQDFKNSLNDYFARLNINNASNEEYVRANNAYVLCAELLDQYFAVAKSQMIDHIKKTSAVKTASVLLEKYKAINNRLRDLNTAISQMYGYFASFKALLPGFVKNCLQS